MVEVVLENEKLVDCRLSFCFSGYAPDKTRNLNDSCNWQYEIDGIYIRESWKIKGKSEWTEGLRIYKSPKRISKQEEADRHENDIQNLDQTKS